MRPKEDRRRPASPEGSALGFVNVLLKTRSRVEELVSSPVSATASAPCAMGPAGIEQLAIVLGPIRTAPLERIEYELSANTTDSRWNEPPVTATPTPLLV